MIAYYDKENDVEYILEEDKTRIGKNAMTELYYTDIEDINLGHNYRTYNRLYHCKIKARGNAYVIKYREDNTLWSVLFNRKKKGQKRIDYVIFVNALHQLLKKHKSKTTYSRGNWFVFILLLTVLFLIIILMLFSITSIFILGFVAITITFNIFFTFPTNYNPNNYKSLLP